MRGRIPLFALLASSLTFLVSLFLPWIGVTTPPPRGAEGVSGVLDLTAGGGQIDGWVGGVGDIAVLLAIAIVVAGIAGLRRPHLAAKLPIGSLGVALGYFAVAVAVQVHALSPLLVGFERHTLHTSWAYGFYLGLASAAVAVLSALAYRRSELRRPQGAADIAAAILGIVLLVSILLPWYEFSVPASYHVYGIALAAAVIAALGLIIGAGWLYPEVGRPWRLPLTIATAVLIGGAFSALPPTNVSASRNYGAWIGLACAVSLVALEAVRAWPVTVPALPRGTTAVRLGAAVLLIVALFLPWQEMHLPVQTGPATNGWYPSTGAAAGSLCLLLLATPALPRLADYVLDATIAVAILVSALATEFRSDSLVFRIGWGAFLGIGAAAILLGTALVHLRPGRVERSRALVRAVPLALSVLCVAAVVVPSWFILPQAWRYQAAPLSSWLAIPGLLLALYLVRLWTIQIRGRARTGGGLTLVPLVLLTLPALELIRDRNDQQVLWGAVILVGLCRLLALFGWIEEDRSLETVRVPEEIWRVDRLPEPKS
jgi:hypothetical protein